jgi:hypothetical protein
VFLSVSSEIFKVRFPSHPPAFQCQWLTYICSGDTKCDRSRNGPTGYHIPGWNLSPKDVKGQLRYLVETVNEARHRCELQDRIFGSKYSIKSWKELPTDLSHPNSQLLWLNDWAALERYDFAPSSIKLRLLSPHKHDVTPILAP